MQGKKRRRSNSFRKVCAFQICWEVPCLQAEDEWEIRGSFNKLCTSLIIDDSTLILMLSCVTV